MISGILLVTSLLFLANQDGESIATSRSVVTGQVVDDASGQPVAGASVFISQSSLGVETDSWGMLELTDVPLGGLDLVVSHIGYEFTARKLRVDQPGESHYRFRLTPRIHSTTGSGIYGGAAVEVVADGPKDWRRRLAIFTREFLGVSEFGQACTILIPLVLDFKVDKRTGLFEAFTDSVLRVETKSLDISFTSYSIPFGIRACSVASRRRARSGVRSRQSSMPSIPCL